MKGNVGTPQFNPVPRREPTMMERLAFLSRGPVEIECRKFAKSTEEWDLSVSGRLEHAAELCKLVRQWLSMPPDQRPVGTPDEFKKYMESLLPSERSEQ